MFTQADHFFQMEAVGRAEDPFLEGYTSLGFLAGQTQRIALGLLVTGSPIATRCTGQDRNHSRCALRGRSVLGIGAAWYEREHVASACLILRLPPGSKCWRRHCRSAGRCGAMTTALPGQALPTCRDGVRARAHSAAGAAGPDRWWRERKTLRLVAQYADIWNFTVPRCRSTSSPTRSMC